MRAPDVTVVLPARYHSTRFPGKPLALIAGKPLIHWVYERASNIRGVSRIVVATDHDDIANSVRDFGGDVVMTGDHATGTDRVAAVARELDTDVVVNLQGDEPLFPPSLVEDMIRVLPGVDIVTACHPITAPAEIASPHVVKIVTDVSGRALYFSRAPIPFARDDGHPIHQRHVGIYVFTRDALLSFAALSPSPLELAENLEQLRALENGMSIRAVKTDYVTVGVDVPGDIKNVEKHLATA